MASFVHTVLLAIGYMYAALIVVVLLLVYYDRHHVFYPIEQVRERINSCERKILDCKNNGDYSLMVTYMDELDFWTDQKNIIEKKFR